RAGGIAVTVSDGQTVTNIDFTLARGGVITGRVTGGDGRPVIAERINLTKVDANGRPQLFIGGNRFSYETDDRGVYRIYGLPAGRYLVSAGGSDRPGVSRRIRYPRTYYPGVVEQERATPVEVRTDFSAEDIDIHLGEPTPTYAVVGRVIDGESGKPAPGLPVNIVPMRVRGAAGGRAIGSPAGSVAGADGAFRVTGLTPGLYSASTGPSGFFGGAAGAPSDFYSDPVSFEINDGDVAGVEIKVHRGASIAGVVVVDGVNDPSVSAHLSQLVISANSRGGQQSQARGGRGVMGGRQNAARVGPDGAFRIGGVAPGRVRLSVFGGRTGFALARVERNGAVVDGEFNVASGEQVTGVRVVVVNAAGVIQGRVAISGGTLPAGTRLMVFVRPLNSAGRNRPAQVDAGGQFRIEGLAPGSYEVRLNAIARGFRGGRGPGGIGRGRGGSGNSQIGIPDIRQTVNVVNGAPSNVTLNLDLSQR
ncbi:MAG TPA: carboxypeptidase-like regulatory domain-containing protein, partial [Blastocatellia bacterium]